MGIWSLAHIKSLFSKSILHKMKEFIKEYGILLFMLNSVVFIGSMMDLIAQPVSSLAVAVAFFYAGFIHGRNY